jgi:hypothetical protein
MGNGEGSFVARDVTVVSTARGQHKIHTRRGTHIPETLVWVWRRVDVHHVRVLRVQVWRIHFQKREREGKQVSASGARERWAGAGRARRPFVRRDEARHCGRCVVIATHTYTETAEWDAGALTHARRHAPHAQSKGCTGSSVEGKGVLGIRSCWTRGVASGGRVASARVWRRLVRCITWPIRENRWTVQQQVHGRSSSALCRQLARSRGISGRSTRYWGAHTRLAAHRSWDSR